MQRDLHSNFPGKVGLLEKITHIQASFGTSFKRPARVERKSYLSKLIMSEVGP